MADQVTVIGAFLAGILSFLSPCVLPLVPPYLAWMAGSTAEAAENRKNLAILSSALMFVLGFTTVFVALGATASALGQWLGQNLEIMGYIAGTVIIVMGLHFMGLFKIMTFYREARFNVNKGEGSLVGAYVMGLAFAFGWTPCIGPVLAAILAVASSQESVGQGAFLLTIYSMGLGIPFLIAAGFAKPFQAFLMRFRQYIPIVEKIMGVLLVLTGLAFITGAMADVAIWILDTFPVLGEIG